MKLEDLRVLSEAATPGNFTIMYGVNLLAGDGWSATNLSSNTLDDKARNEANAAFIVAACAYVRERLRAESPQSPATSG